MSADISGRMASGAAWMIALRFTVTGLGFVSTIVLARLLVPADFGLIALGTSVLAALELLTSYRFDVPLIQNQSATRADYDTAWTLNLLAGATLAVLLALSAWPAALFFKEPRLTEVILVLALAAAVDGAQNIGIVDFRKRLEFRREFAFSVTRKLVGVVVAAACAWRFRSYWALAAGIIASSLTGLAASFAMHPYRPRWSLASMGELVRFSKWLLLDNALYFLRHRSSDFLIGRAAGAGALGVFNLAYELASLAQSSLIAPVSRAVFPAYSRMSNDPAALRDSFVAVVGATTLIAVPVAAGIAALAPLLVPLLLGPKWQEAVELMRILGLASVISVLGSASVTIYLAMKRPGLVVLQGVTYVVVLLSTMALMLRDLGLPGVAWSFVIAASVNLPIQVFTAHWALGSILARWWAAVWRSVAAVILMYGCVSWIVDRTVVESGALPALLAMLGAIAAGALTYVGTLLLCWRLSGCPPGAERFMWDRARALLP